MPRTKRVVKEEVETPRENRNTKGWKTINRKTVEGWEKGKTIEGIYLSSKQGQYGKLLRIEFGNGDIKTVGAPTILANYMEDIKVGTQVRIKCLGKIETANGDAWDFEVQYR